MESLEQLLTVCELAAILKISPRTIYVRSSQQRLPVVKLGRSLRFRRSDIEKVIQKGFRPACEESGENRDAEIAREGGAK